MFRSELSLLSTSTFNTNNFSESAQFFIFFVFVIIIIWIMLFASIFLFKSPWIFFLSESHQIQLNYTPSMQWWSANVARFCSFLFPLLQFAPFSFSFQNPDFRLPNHAWFVNWVCRSDWFCLFRSTVGNLRALAFCLICFLFSFSYAYGWWKQVLELEHRIDTSY